MEQPTQWDQWRNLNQQAKDAARRHGRGSAKAHAATERAKAALANLSKRPVPPRDTTTG